MYCVPYTYFENDPKAAEVSEAPMFFKSVLNLCPKQLGKKQLRENMMKVIKIAGCKLWITREELFFFKK